MQECLREDLREKCPYKEEDMEFKETRRRLKVTGGVESWWNCQSIPCLFAIECLLKGDKTNDTERN